MRMTGKTTRLVDEAIQELFTKGRVCVPSRLEIKKGVKGIDTSIKIFIDEDSDVSNYAQEHFKEVLLRRLRVEHHEKYYKIIGNMIFANQYL